MPESLQIEILVGGAPVLVTYQDGKTESVFVRKISLRNMPELGAALASEAKEILHYTGQTDAEWLDTLTDESYESLLQEGRRLNFSRFKKFFDRQQKMLTDLNLNGEQSALVAAAVREQLQKTT